jgi:DNA-binding transcriptional LysR family regulator
MLKETYICIGLAPLFHNIVTPVLTRIVKSHPEINFQIVNSVTTQILQGVSDLEINLGVILRTDYQGFNVRAQEVSEKERLVFVTVNELANCQQAKVEW